MSSVVVEADRKAGEGPLSVLFGRDDGATRIWAIHMAPPAHFHIGLHRHGGDEIWRVQRGSIRITVGDTHLDCGAGETVVVPPEVAHGVMVLSDDAEAEVLGELEMGEWVTVIDPDEARGLEFDAVIVVEPADFPQNYGRQGPLYTALTRPNRELAIVHAKPLPDALRRR